MRVVHIFRNESRPLRASFCFSSSQIREVTNTRSAKTQIVFFTTRPINQKITMNSREVSHAGRNPKSYRLLKNTVFVNTFDRVSNHFSPPPQTQNVLFVKKRCSGMYSWATLTTKCERGHSYATLTFRHYALQRSLIAQNIWKFSKHLKVYTKQFCKRLHTRYPSSTSPAVSFSLSLKSHSISDDMFTWAKA